MKNKMYFIIFLFFVVNTKIRFLKFQIYIILVEEGEMHNS